ncbi:MAG TPA: aromatic ring-hydroxylating dioxygenase subunit alpha [Sphingobium sp.]|uniref:aromatic ring-hydroxylating oxygenase subunit alpha n=1 Tax=Sphingobium sp. TaxID=1912891 RepID=UPI002ECFDA11
MTTQLHMAEANPTLDHVPHAVTHPARIPSKRYYDEEFFRLENERFWPHAWQLAARLDQIPEVGDWTTYQILDKSVVVVRAKDGVKAYHNACRHRGVRLAKGHGNCRKQGFICPFHGWRWNMEGENTFVYGRHMFGDDQLDVESLRLPEVRTEIWGGCVFINFDPEAPSYRETIGPLANSLDAHHVGDLRAEWWYATVLPSNWKVAMEAFMEGYHVMRTHPQLHSALGVMYNALYGQDTGGIGQPVNPNMTARENVAAHIKHLELLSEGMAGMVHRKEVAIAQSLADVELPEDPQAAVMTWYGILNDQLTTQLRARGENVPNLNEVKVSHYIHPIEFLFPHYFLLPMFTSMSAYRIRPLTAETCYFETWSLTHMSPDEPFESPKEPTVLAYDSPDFPPIPQQDYANIPEQQIGLHAGGFDFMRLGKDVEGLVSNYQRIIDGYLAGAPKEKLAEATQKLGGNFDGPILDLGLEP